MKRVRSVGGSDANLVEVPCRSQESQNKLSKLWSKTWNPYATEQYLECCRTGI